MLVDYDVKRNIQGKQRTPDELQAFCKYWTDALWSDQPNFARDAILQLNTCQLNVSFTGQFICIGHFIFSRFCR